MRYFAVLDTNVLVSALLSRNAAPSKILDESLSGRIIPLYNNEILAEYENVLNRKKFCFEKAQISALINAVKARGFYIAADSFGDLSLPDPDDAVFYAVVMEKRKEEDAYLVTGNQKHFPKEPFIVTPREMLDIIESGSLTAGTSPISK